MTISLMQRLDVPARCGRTRSPASRAARDGSAARPATPKSSTVLTSPVPKSICQKRLTATRAVSGLAGSTSQRARPSRSAGAPCGQRRQAAPGRRARPARPACRTAPRIRTYVVARRRHLLHDHRRRECSRPARRARPRERRPRASGRSDRRRGAGRQEVRAELRAPGRSVRALGRDRARSSAIDSRRRPGSRRPRRREHAS